MEEAWWHTGENGAGEVAENHILISWLTERERETLGLA